MPNFSTVPEARCDQTSECKFPPCLLVYALNSHIDRVALLTGRERCAWNLQRLVFHEVWRTRSPFLPHHTKQERRALTSEIGRRVAAEREEVRQTAASVVAEAEARRAELADAERTSARCILQSVQTDISTELLDEASGWSYFEALLEESRETAAAARVETD